MSLREEGRFMVTIVTEIQVRDGAEHEWDAIMRKRMAAAKGQPGWIGGQLLRSGERPNRRMIVGTWKSRGDWEKWHKNPLFAGTRRQLDEMASGPEVHEWHEVVLDVRKGGTTTTSAASKGRGKRASKKKAVARR
jgi:heme-degrading monooxygenase HmoA